MHKKIAVSFGVFAVLFLISACQAKDVAIVVNKANPITELSLQDLRQIFKAERQFWDGKKIHLLMREEGAWEKEIILKKVYTMSDEELKKFWLGKIFRGEVTTFPQIISSPLMINKLIQNLAGAIGFLDSQAVDANVKVIKIEGRLPGQEGYALKKEQE